MSRDQDDLILRDKAVRIFRYLRELSVLKSKIKRDISEYERVVWFYEVPDLKSCFSVTSAISDETHDGIWLEIKKSFEPKKPLVPISCTKWIQHPQSDDPLIEPDLCNQILKPSKPGQEPASRSGRIADEYELLSHHPEVTQDWQKYLADEWQPWAASYRIWKAADDLYFKLFWMHQQQKKLGEQFELVLGLGLLSWQTPDNQLIKRHIIVGDASLEFDADRAKFLIRGASDGIKLRFETEMIEPNDLPPLEKQQVLEELLAPVQESPWNIEEIRKILRSWVHLLSPEGQFLDIPVPPERVEKYPVISFSPAIILRRRTERGQILCFNKIIDQLSNEGAVPSGVRLLCEISDDDPYSAPEPDISSASNKGPDPLYLPLEVNDEQFQILRQLNLRKGILVQGPPGTGKSHTIANLICHLLAQGKRVLVTSQTPRALKVLKEKIPEELKALCVVLLGNDQESHQELEESVQSINTRYSNWNSSSGKAQISKLEADLQKVVADLEEQERLLRENREIESHEHVVAGGAYQGTVQNIAGQIQLNEAKFSWFCDEIDPKNACSISNSELKELNSLYRELTDEVCNNARLKTIDLSEIPDLSSLVKFIEEEKKASQKWGECQSRSTAKRFQILERIPENTRIQLIDSLRKLETAAGNIKKRFPWVPNAVKDILDENESSWKELESFTSQRLKDLELKASLAQTIKLEYPPSTEGSKLLADARQLLTHISNGGKIGWKFLAPEVVRKNRYILDVVKVNGNLCSNENNLKLLVTYLETAEAIDQTWNAWAGKDKKEEGSFIVQVGNLKERLETLDSILGLQAYLGRVKEIMRTVEGLTELQWSNSSEIDDIIADLQGFGCLRELNHIREHLDSYALKSGSFKLLPKSHKINSELQIAISNRDEKKYAACLEKVKALEKTRALIQRRDTLKQKLESLTPIFSQQFCDNYNDAVWTQRANEFAQAWDWKQADQWLIIFNQEHDREHIESSIQSLTRKQRELTSQLAAAKSWQSSLEKLTEFQRANLIAWALAIKKYGKGTGKYAPLYLKQAQDCMEKCKGAIPAWIMPLYRVFETINPQPEMFDVVIIDEASQTGPEGVVLQYLGKQIIVVGDSEQISPEAVGTELSSVNSLIAKHLKDIPFNERYDPNTSFFNQAEIRYAGRVVLREHFRCMPEIIQFSNDLCYKATPLKPLRQYPPNRLEPIVACYVENGAREGSGGRAINRIEADELVKAVNSICSSFRYEDKTLGVISLQGEEQAKYIESQLISSLAPSEIQKRRLICGDAYAFQGDERDVIFLSMVAAPNERIGTLTGEAAKRRFNVAASRARDQVWLFYSVTLNDLNPECMRYQLLKYYLGPEIHRLEVDISQCESQFEKDVFQAISRKNYRVVPQFNVAEYRIDMVVEGPKNRLAIECDGDPWHGIEQFEKDMARQRILERCGWRFWRIRGSEYYRDPEKALNTLWKMLSEMEIEPIAEVDTQPGLPKDVLPSSSPLDGRS